MNKKLRTIHLYYNSLYTIKKNQQFLKIEIKGREIIKIKFKLNISIIVSIKQVQVIVTFI